MNKRVHGIIEIVLASILVITGFIVALKFEIIKDAIIWVMIGFFVFKIAFVVLKYFTYESSLVYTIIHGVLNGLVMIFLIIFKEEANKLAVVIGCSCTVDVVSNIAKAIIYRKSDQHEAFFGMENTICVLFILLIFGGEKTAVTTTVLFGCLMLYKGVATLLSNRYVKKAISLTELGKALNRVHALDVVFGLFIVLLLASFILPQVEDTINNYGDAWWYCFALITTIGFGDITVSSVIARILSVIIAFYGIIIVSLLTSSIVVYISELNKKEEIERRNAAKQKLKPITLEELAAKEPEIKKPRIVKKSSNVDQINLFEEAKIEETKPVEVKEEPKVEEEKPTKKSNSKKLTIKKVDAPVAEVKAETKEVKEEVKESPKTEKPAKAAPKKEPAKASAPKKSKATKKETK